MDRRQTLKLIGGATVMAGAGFPGLAFAWPKTSAGAGFVFVLTRETLG